MQSVAPPATPQTSILFQCEYGRFRTGYLILFFLAALIGLAAAPIGLFWNTGWKMGRAPLEPWTVTVIVEIFALVALAVGCITPLGHFYRRKAPQRVAITPTSLIVPRGMFSRGELELPFASIRTQVFHVGFVKQLQILHGRKKTLLTSAAFPTEADFDRLVSHLPH